MIPDINTFADIHTHGHTAPDIVTNLRPREQPSGTPGSAWFSAGIHPWDTARQLSPQDWEWLGDLAYSPRVVAIGECGLDALAGAPLSEQQTVFLKHAELAAEVGKPLIIHCVRAWHILLALKDRMPDNVRRIIHGFRGKPQLARQLLDAGFDLSYGRRYNRESFLSTPSARRFRESDTDKLL